MSRKSKLPKSPLGRNTASEKKPFHIKMKIGSDHQPHTGQIATIREITLIKPTTAPIDTNLGLYYSMFFVFAILGIIKAEKSIRQTMSVYPAMLISKKS